MSVQTCNLENQFISENVGKPAITSLEFVRYNAPRIFNNADSFRHFYGYVPDLRKPPYSADHDGAPYLISKLCYLIPSTGKTIVTPMPIFTMRQLKEYFIAVSKAKDTAYLIPKQLYTIDVNLENTGVTELNLTESSVFIQGDKNRSFDLVQSVSEATNLPGKWKSKFSFSFYADYNKFLRPFTLSVELFYTSTYNNKKDSTVTLIKCDPAELIFYPRQVR